MPPQPASTLQVSLHAEGQGAFFGTVHDTRILVDGTRLVLGFAESRRPSLEAGEAIRLVLSGPGLSSELRAVGRVLQAHASTVEHRLEVALKGADSCLDPIETRRGGHRVRVVDVCRARVESQSGSGRDLPAHAELHDVSVGGLSFVVPIADHPEWATEEALEVSFELPGAGGFYLRGEVRYRQVVEDRAQYGIRFAEAVKGDFVEQLGRLNDFVHGRLGVLPPEGRLTPGARP